MVWLRNPRQFKALIETVRSNQNARQVRRLILAYNKGTVPKNQVAIAASNFTSIKELSLRNMKLDDLTVLNAFRGLESLTLEAIRQAKGRCFTLLHLKHLTIGQGCDIDLAKMKHENAPRIAALALRRSTKYRLDGLVPRLSSTTPWNLDVLNLDWHSSYSWNDPLPNVLVNARSDFAHKLLFTGAQHVRIVEHRRNLLPFLDRNQAILKLVSQKPVPLETLILPNRFNPEITSSSPSSPPQPRKPGSIYWQIVRGCQERGIELICEELPNSELDSDISQAFVRKMERMQKAHPHCFSPSSYQDRVDLLSEFSLVSRTFKNVSDPILYSTFWARNSRQLKNFLRSVKAKGFAARVHKLVLEFDGKQISKSQVVTAAKVLTSIRELSVSNSVTTQRPSSILPHLEDLTIGQKCAIDLSKMEDRNAPQLSALALRRKTNLKAWTPSLSSTTPWNLNAFVFDWDEDYRWTSPLPNVLVNLHLQDGHYADAIPSIIGNNIQHLRIYLGPLPLHLDTHLIGIRIFVNNSSIPLETLVVPSYLEPARFSSTLSSEDGMTAKEAHDLRLLAKLVVDECTARKIDLIFEEQPDGKFDSDVSKVFMRKMDVQKCEREARLESEAEAEEV
ncbi:hypothetical protein JCM3765_001435 [Sporobolomyces pararoseus]